MTPNYYYHFLQAFFNELLGRYAHLQQFVERTRLETGIKSPKLLEVYSRQLETRINKLVDSSEDLWNASSSEIDPAYLKYLFNGLKNESDNFQKLHGTLRWFSAPWPEAEVFEFLDRVFDERGLKKHFELLNPSIVFSDEYNFLTYDVGYVHMGISRAELTAWAIPKSESTNPLLWSLLVHEVAHSYFKEPILFNFVSRAFRKRATKESMDLICRWAVELNADLFGFRSLGPAYLCSLIYLSMFFVSANLHQPLQRRDSRSFHPPPFHRIKLLQREAPRATLIAGSIQGDVNNVLGVFDKLFNMRLEYDADDGFEASDYNELYLSDDTLDHLWETLKAFQREYCRDFTMFHNDFSSPFELSKRLDEGILAGSLAHDLDRKTIEEFVRHSYDMSSDASPEEAARATVQRSSLRRHALSKLKEEPATMFDIMNAGWMNKVRGHAWKVPVFEEISKQQDRSVYLPRLLNSLTEPARQLQMSIQVALVLSSVM